MEPLFLQNMFFESAWSLAYFRLISTQPQKITDAIKQTTWFNQKCDVDGSENSTCYAGR